MAFTAMTGCSDSKETGAPAETSGGDTRTLVGTIEDIANATIAVRDEEGETYIFERDDSLVSVNRRSHAHRRRYPRRICG